MAVKRLTPETLVALASQTLRSEIVPVLPPEHRYTAAMILNALEIARRELIQDEEEAQWGLLDRLYDDGEGSLARLAADIRSGAAETAARSKGLDLAAELRALIVAELKVRNPKALAELGG